MSLPLFPENTRNTIEEIINMIGREVVFYDEVTVSGCSICSLDPVANTSTDSFCPVCSGNYWIPIYSGLPLIAHVTYGQVDNKSWQTGGMIDNGTITAKVMYSGWIADWINDADYVIIDGREYDVIDVDNRGVPEVNRILVKLKEKER